jgi:hypothetical protein
MGRRNTLFLPQEEMKKIRVKTKTKTNIKTKPKINSRQNLSASNQQQQ